MSPLIGVPDRFLTPALATPKAGDSPERIIESARQFESILLTQMLKSMRGEGKGWMGTGEDASSESLMEHAEQQFAQVMAQAGGLGLARMIADSLARQSAQPRRAEGSVAPAPAR